MMHGCEKSGPVVGAGKPANKTERSAAEPVERRTAAEGNARQNRERRAQNQRSVSEALARNGGRQGASRRHPPELGAVYGQAARTGLRGGCAVNARPYGDQFTCANLLLVRTCYLCEHVRGRCGVVRASTSEDYNFQFD